MLVIGTEVINRVGQRAIIIATKYKLYVLSYINSKCLLFDVSFLQWEADGWVIFSNEYNIDSTCFVEWED